MAKIRPEKRAIENRERIDDFISGSQVVRIGMISRGEPYIVPVNFVYQDRTVYFHCARTGRKYSSLESGSRVCLEFDEMHGINVTGADTWYTSVLAWGNAVIVQERSLCRKVLEMLVKKYLGTEVEITDAMLDRTCIAGVCVEEVTGKENLPQS